MKDERLSTQIHHLLKKWNYLVMYPRTLNEIRMDRRCSCRYQVERMLLNEKSKLSSMELEDSTRRIWWCGSVAAEMAAGGGDD